MASARTSRPARTGSVLAEHWYPLTLLFVFLCATVLLGIAPVSRNVWLMENLLVALAVPLLILFGPRLRISWPAYTCIAVFLLFQEIGAHYSYWNVPFFTQLWQLLGTSRDHYDRVVHFIFGITIGYAILEQLERRCRHWGRAALWTIAAILAASLIFEVGEYTFAQLVAPESAAVYLGLQGDIYDPVKDTLCAVGGAIVTIIAVDVWRRFRSARRVSS